MRRSRHAFTLLEAVVVLALIGIISLFAISQFGGGNVEAGDRIAKSSADAAIDAVVSVATLSGDLAAATPARLAGEEATLTFLGANTVSSSSNDVSVSVDATRGAVGAAVRSVDGSCWMERVNVYGDNTQPSRRYALAIPEANLTCTGTTALGLDTLAATGTQGTSWNEPLIRSA